jgi:hypothetical protein
VTRHRAGGSTQSRRVRGIPTVNQTADSVRRAAPRGPGATATRGSDIWNPDPSDNFWDFGIRQDIHFSKDILGISLTYPIFVISN